MILREPSGQVLTCTICEEKIAVSRSTAANPEEMAIAVERVTDDHAECEKYSNDIPRAIRERAFRKRMEREQRKHRRAA